MILVDTSVWVDFWQRGDSELADLLNASRILAHPFVTGEVALGSFKQRETLLEALQALPQAHVATDNEVLHFIGDQSLYGIGIGYVDAHLLAAVRLTPGTLLWTRDKRLLEASLRLGVAANPVH